jgi:hypothetical protein
VGPRICSTAERVYSLADRVVGISNLVKIMSPMSERSRMYLPAFALSESHSLKNFVQIVEVSNAICESVHLEGC